MAVPTISSISPNSGRTSGRNIVKIVGTNFRVAPAPPPTGYLGGEAQQTVSVKFEGVRSEWAEAASSTLALARVPAWAGAYTNIPLTLDVRLANLDNAGAEIVGENVTKVDAYTILRPSLVEESTIQKVCREVIAVFRRHLLENTHITMSRDFDDDPASLQRVLAEVPVVYLVGPATPPNRLRHLHQIEPVETVPTEFIRNEAPVAVDLNFQIRAFAQGMDHMLSLQQELILLFRDAPYLNVAGQIPLEFRMPFSGYPTTITIPGLSDLYSIYAQMTIFGVQLDSASGTIIERGWEIFYNDGEPILDIQPIGE